MVNLNKYRKVPAHHTTELFVEVQRYHRGWMWLLLSLTFVALLAIIVAQWVLFTHPTDYWLSASSLALIGVVLLLLVGLVYKAHLVTRIDKYGVQFRLFPFQWYYRQIYWQEVEEVYIREYEAISDYGGWGVRYSQQGKSYTMAGQFGIQLVLSNEQRVLIGTQRPIELEQLILKLLYDYELK